MSKKQEEIYKKQIKSKIWEKYGKRNIYDYKCFEALKKEIQRKRRMK